MQAKEFADFTGVSVRTLHYYDEIGLLKPAYVEERTGYRYYDRASLERMQEILFYRELDFPLKSICEILSSPNYDKQKALEQQKRLLVLKKERLERLIEALDNAKEGEYVMKAFDNKEYEETREQYEKEVKERWGETNAYKEHQEKTKSYSKEKWQDINNGLDKILEEFALCKADGARYDSEETRALVQKLQSHITENYYTCTDEILAGLGKMYVADERFRKNIDKHGEGTAAFISEAIERYCL
ncbi:MAG: MerR family transcriptional regulator [Lachnospiraceae bacterium]|nr:MerR family transcriptional regulator [Lachnospiraceae bacterium]